MSTSKETLQYYKDNGICINCGQEYAEKGSQYCLACRESKREYNREYMRTHRKNYDYKALNKARRERLKAQGVCIDCGKRKAIVGRSVCIECSTRRRIADTRRRGFLGIQYRKEQGICLKCNDKVQEGYCYCEKHLKQAREACRKAQQKRWLRKQSVSSS